MKFYSMQYCINTFVCVRHENDVSNSLVNDISINNATVSACIKDDDDDDNLFFVSNAIHRETPILQVETVFFCFLAK